MKEEIWNELYLYLIRFEIGVLKNFRRNVFARPVMGTIFLVYIIIYVCACVCRGPKSVGGITWAKRAHAQSQYWAYIQNNFKQ